MGHVVTGEDCGVVQGGIPCVFHGWCSARCGKPLIESVSDDTPELAPCLCALNFIKKRFHRCFSLGVFPALNHVILSLNGRATAWALSHRTVFGLAELAFSVAGRLEVIDKFHVLDFLCHRQPPEVDPEVMGVNLIPSVFGPSLFCCEIVFEG